MAAPSVELTDVEAGQGSGPTTSIDLPPEPVTGQGFLKPIPETTQMERVAGVVAGGAVATSLAAMIIEQSAIVIVGGVLSSIVGPYAYWQQTRLTDIKALQETQRAVQAAVDQLQDENDRLSHNVEDMTESVQHLQDVEEALDVITKTQGQSVSAFAKQVEDNKQILQQMRSNVQANVLQNMLSVILKSDADGDFVISESEIQDVVRRIRNMGGVEIHEDRFRQAVQGQSVDVVMDICKNLLKDDVPEEERIFEIAQ